MKSLVQFVIYCCLSGTLLAQAPNIQWGIQTGNNLSLPGGANTDIFEGKTLLRYSVGLLGRKVLKRDLKFRYIAPVRRGVIAFDFGLNLVFKGFNYVFRDFESFQDQISLEAPLLFLFYDERNIFAPRKWYRKGLATFTRMGVKPSWQPQRRQERIFSHNGQRLTESTSTGGFNILFSLSGGLLQNHKNGNSTAVELAGNLGFIRSTTGELSTASRNGSITDTGKFGHSGSYLSLNLIYLFQMKSTRPTKRRKLPQIIYNPRHMDAAK